MKTLQRFETIKNSFKDEFNAIGSYSELLIAIALFEEGMSWGLAKGEAFELAQGFEEENNVPNYLMKQHI